MAYSTHRPGGREVRIALGAVDIGSLLGTATSIIQNPYVPEVLCRVKQLDAFHRGQPVADCQVTPSVPDALGIGKFMMPIRGYVYAEQHPWAYAVGAAVVLGVPFLLGYLAGRK